MLVLGGGLLLAAPIARTPQDPGGQPAGGLSPGEGPRALAHEDDQVLDASAELKRDGESRAARRMRRVGPIRRG